MINVTRIHAASTTVAVMRTFFGIRSFLRFLGRKNLTMPSITAWKRPGTILNLGTAKRRIRAAAMITAMTIEKQVSHTRLTGSPKKEAAPEAFDAAEGLQWMA